MTAMFTAEVCTCRRPLCMSQGQHWSKIMKPPQSKAAKLTNANGGTFIWDQLL